MKISEIDPVHVANVHAVVKHTNLPSFVKRSAESELRTALRLPQHYVIALHGASKQGKTNILRSVFEEDFEALHIELGADATAERIYRTLLAQTRAKVGVTVKKTGKTTWGFDKIFVGKVEGEIEQGHGQIDGDCSEINWVMDTLAASTKRKIIVLDNFHHVREEQQDTLAKDFTCLGGRGYKVVIAGTWKDSDYLSASNTDLNEGYTSISIDPWSEHELEAVVRQGAKVLQYDIPSASVSALAKISKGSVSALQAITQRYYLDQIAGSPKYIKVSDAEKANLAAQAVANVRVKDLAKQLFEIAQWGKIDEGGRTGVSYVVEAILGAPPDDLKEGFSLADLRARSENCVRAWGKYLNRKIAAMSASEFASKVQSGWMSHQIAKNNTPIVVYDRHAKKVTVNDSMLTFVHSLTPQTLRAEYAACLRRAS